MRRLVVLAALAASLVAAAPAAAEDGPAAAELAARHAPVLGLRTQAKPCAAGEPYRPVAVEVVLGSPDVLLVAPDRETPPTPAPTAADLAGKGEGWRLDLPGTALRPGCTYERWFRAAAAGKPTVAYARVATQPDRPGRLALQYWLYYTYNDFNDKHEGDWEMLQLLFDASTAEEALAQEPVSVGVSQHEGGQVAPWRGGELSTVDGHPVIYPGAGSHANYFTQALWLGRDAEQGFGCDDTRAPTTLEQSEAILLPDRVDDAAGPFAWLLFTGRWGEKRAGFNNGPTGPQTKGVWREPIDWHDDLRDEAVKVPGQGTVGQSVTGAFCWTVEAGSSALWYSIERPWVALGIALLVLGLVGTGLKRTRWSPAEPVPLARARTVGQILRAGRRIYGESPRTFLAIGAVFVPIAIVVDGVQNLLLRLTPLATVREVSGDESVASSLLALLIGGLGVSLGILLVTGAVAAALAARQRSAPVGGLGAYRALRPHARAIGGIVLRTVPLYVVLVSLVVTIPVAVWLGVRWAVAVHACVLEDLGAREAMRRSRALVRGNAARTLAFTATVYGIGLATGPIVGLLLLFLASSWSLATINAIGSLVNLAIFPYVGIATTLLFHDLRERTHGATPEADDLAAAAPAPPAPA